MMRTRASLWVSVVMAGPAGAQPFVDRTDELGLALGNGPAAWGDVNGDGWPDLCCGRAVWVNDGAGGFVRVDAPASGLIADIDGDGDGDLVSFAPVGVWRNVGGAPPPIRPGADHPLRRAEGDGEQAGSLHHKDEQSGTLHHDEEPAGSLHNNGDIVFERVVLPELPETRSRGAAVGDFDGDGLLDVYVGGYEQWEPQRTYADVLLLADGAGSFEVSMTYAERRARGVTACDFDADGDLDVYVSNYRLQPNVLWVNDGRGGMTDGGAAMGVLATSEGFGGGHSIGSCWGDFDGDGWIDLFAGNFAHVDSRGDQPKSRFLRNRGDDGAGVHAGFDDFAECGVWYQESYASPAAADFDNDGDLDLYFTTVYADASFGRKNFPVLYRNDTEAGGAWAFTDVTEGSGLEELPPTYQAAWADYDGDGDVDLVTAGRLYENRLASDAHWLAVRLVGDGAGGRDAVGAQARVALLDGRVLTRQVEIGTGEGNANATLLHFGLGAFGGQVTVEVLWPGGGRSVVEGVGVDRRVVIAR